MRTFASLCVLLMIFSCSSSKNTTSKNSNSLQGTRWQLTELRGNKISDDGMRGRAYLEFSADENLSGQLPCNRLTSTYKARKNGTMSFGELATTKMACPEQGNTEREMLETLNSTHRYTIKDGKLTLRTDDGFALAVFEKDADNQIVNKYWKLVKLEGQEVSMVENQEREQYFILKSDSSVAGFAGCNHITGQYELQRGMRIRFDKMATTLKLCQDVDVDEPEFMKVFELADNYRVEGDYLWLNVGKRAPLAEFEAVYFD